MLKILLLEDSVSDADHFIDQYASSLISITVSSSVQELFLKLEQEEFDLVIIDPMMTSTIDFPTLIKEVKNKKLKLIITHPGKYLNDLYRQQAYNQKVPIIPLDDSGKITEILTKLLKTKSASGDNRDQRQQEIKLVTLEIKVDQLITETGKQSKAIDEIQTNTNLHGLKLNELELNQTYMKDTLGTIYGDLKVVASEVDQISGKDPRLDLALKDKEEKTKRSQYHWMAIVAIITAIASIIVATVPHAFQYGFRTGTENSTQNQKGNDKK